MPEKIPIAYDVKSMLLGSVSAGVLHHSKRPVLVVPPPDRSLDSANGPLLIGYDGSEQARRAIQRCGELLGGRAALVVTVWTSTRDMASAAVLGACGCGSRCREARRGGQGRSGVQAAEGAEVARAAGLDASSAAEQSTGNVWATLTGLVCESGARDRGRIARPLAAWKGAPRQRVRRGRASLARSGVGCPARPPRVDVARHAATSRVGEPLTGAPGPDPEEALDLLLRDLGTRRLFHTAALGPAELALLAAFPPLVSGPDELRRWRDQAECAGSVVSHDRMADIAGCGRGAVRPNVSPMSSSPARSPRQVALAAAGKLGAAAVVDYLDRKGWRYELIEHEPTVRAVDEASASGVPPEREAKTILLTGASGRLLATIPASERLDVRKARELQGDPHLRLATEDEMAARFPLFDVGALPPIGPLMSAPQIIDRRLTDHSRIVASAGDHSHSLLLIPAELVRRTASRVADICED